MGRNNSWPTTSNKGGLLEALEKFRQESINFLMCTHACEFGYCLVENALSQEPLHTMRTRVLEQAEGERLAGIAHFLNASRDLENRL